MSSERRKPQESVAWLALFALAIWDINDASGPKAVPSAGLFLGIVAGLMLVGVSIRHSQKVALPRIPVLLICGCLAAGLAMIPFRSDFYLGYVLSDVGTLLFFILSLYFASLYREELLSTRTVCWFAIIYVGVAAFAYFAAAVNLRPAFWWNGRWDPPYFMLFAALALLTRHGSTLVWRMTAFFTLSAMLALALSSGNRTQFGLGLIFVGLAWASNHLAALLMCTVAVLFLLLRQLGIIAFDPFGEFLGESRFALLQGGLDESLVGRLREVNDIWYHFVELNTPAQSIFGRGAGATWHPVTRFLQGEDADVYYLHSGIAHMTYRYGVLGLALFGFWIWAAVANLKMAFDSAASVGERFWFLGAFGFSLNFFLQNSLYDPPAVLAMAVLLVVVHRRIAQSREPVVRATTGSSRR